MASALGLLALIVPAYGFFSCDFVASRVRHAPVTSPSITSTRMVAAPEKVTTGVKRNENFAKLKVKVILM